MLMLMIVLGSGRGLENGVRGMFTGFATNSVYLWGQATSMPYKGLPKGRRMSFENADIDFLRRMVPEIDVMAPRNQLGGYMGGNNVTYNNKTGAFSVNGDYPEIQLINQVFIDTGRFINNNDIDLSRKIAIIGKRVADVLFEGETCLGKNIKINGVYFQVVGKFHTKKSGDQAERDEQTIFIPFSTFQRAFNMGNEIGWFALTCRPNSSGAVVESKIRTVLARKYQVHPDDDRAFGSFNADEKFSSMEMVFKAVNFVAWFVGLMTLLAGVIGVSNIMLVVIKERTKEFGIKRAIGAKPWSIIIQVILESVTLTTLAGYLGMVLGIWLLAAVSSMGIGSQFFQNPEVALKTAFTSLVILVVCGVLAGILPAQRAVRIKPVDALRDE
jgi:putative ABC transport system permease protein